VVLGFPYYYADYSSEPIATPPPQVVVVQMPPVATAQATAPASVEPLLLELRGNRYVKVRSEDSADSDTVVESIADPVSRKVKVLAAIDPGPTPQLPPAVLVFRDGHRERVREYTIANGMLYASGNYWADGYWTKTIPLSALDLTSTQSDSHANGVNFILPAASNEVIIRP